MMQPKIQKYRKQFRGKRTGVAGANNTVTYGEYGLKLMECGWLNAREIEAGRRAMTSYIKRKGRVWIKIFPDKPYTQKPNNSKMLGGKGEIEGYVAVVRPGNIIYEIAGVSEDIAREALKLAGDKISIKTKFIERKEI